MVCVSLAPYLSVPMIPNIPTLNTNVALTFPPTPITVGVPCCHLTVPNFYISIPVSEILAPLLADLQVLNGIISAVNASIQIYVKSLPALYIPNCPLDGTTV